MIRSFSDGAFEQVQLFIIIFFVIIHKERKTFLSLNETLLKLCESPNIQDSGVSGIVNS